MIFRPLKRGLLARNLVYFLRAIYRRWSCGQTEAIDNSPHGCAPASFEVLGREMLRTVGFQVMREKADTHLIRLGAIRVG